MEDLQLNNKSTRKDIDQYIDKLTNTITTLDENVTTKTIKEKTIKKKYCPRKNPSHEIISTIGTRHDDTIITGDFNCRHENFGHDTADKHGKLPIQYTEDNNFSKYRRRTNLHK